MNFLILLFISKIKIKDETWTFLIPDSILHHMDFFFGIISILYTLVYIIDKINVVDILGIPRL